jgi:hypothetical protein
LAPLTAVCSADHEDTVVRFAAAGNAAARHDIKMRGQAAALILDMW